MSWPWLGRAYSSRTYKNVVTRGLVGPTQRGHGERNKFFNHSKMVEDDPDLQGSYVEGGYSVVVAAIV